MTYLLIIFILLLIIAPVIAILPSRDQKARMSKRREAMGRGFGVDLTSVEDPDPDPDKYLSATGKPLPRRLAVAAYRCVRKKLRDGRPFDFSLALQRHPVRKAKALTEGWYWQAPPDMVPNNLIEFLIKRIAGLPADVVRVEEQNGIVTLYWHEQGDVQAVIAFLEDYASLNLPPGITESGNR